MSFVGFWARLSVNCKKGVYVAKKRATIQLHHKMNEFIQKISSLANCIVSFSFKGKSTMQLIVLESFMSYVSRFFLVQFAIYTVMTPEDLYEVILSEATNLNQ